MNMDEYEHGQVRTSHKRLLTALSAVKRLWSRIRTALHTSLYVCLLVLAPWSGRYVHVCEYVCVYVCTYTATCICIYVYTYAHIYICKYKKHKCVYMNIHICNYVPIPGVGPPGSAVLDWSSHPVFPVMINSRALLFQLFRATHDSVLVLLQRQDASGPVFVLSSSNPPMNLC